MKIEIKKIADLKPYLKNTKEHTPDQIAKIAKSIEINGFLQPLIIDKDNTVIAGHGRLLAAQRLEMTELPCIVYEKSKSKARALRIADNKLNESKWLMDLVREEIKEIDESDLEYTFLEDYILNIDDDLELNNEINSDEIDFKDVYKIEISCNSFEDQKNKFDELTKLNYKCKLLNL